nr:MAG TPA: hypothetical protein [Caudoviricetes sp.]
MDRSPGVVTAMVERYSFVPSSNSAMDTLSWLRPTAVPALYATMREEIRLSLAVMWNGVLAGTDFSAICALYMTGAATNPMLPPAARPQISFPKYAIPAISLSCIIVGISIPPGVNFGGILFAGGRQRIVCGFICQYDYFDAVTRIAFGARKTLGAGISFGACFASRALFTLRARVSLFAFWALWTSDARVAFLPLCSRVTLVSLWTLGTGLTGRAFRAGVSFGALNVAHVFPCFYRCVPNKQVTHYQIGVACVPGGMVVFEFIESIIGTKNRKPLAIVSFRSLYTSRSLFPLRSLGACRSLRAGWTLLSRQCSGSICVIHLFHLGHRSFKRGAWDRYQPVVLFRDRGRIPIPVRGGSHMQFSLCGTVDGVPRLCLQPNFQLAGAQQSAGQQVADRLGQRLGLIHAARIAKPQRISILPFPARRQYHFQLCIMMLTSLARKGILRGQGVVFDGQCNNTHQTTSMRAS